MKARKAKRIRCRRGGRGGPPLTLPDHAHAGAEAMQWTREKCVARVGAHGMARRHLGGSILQRSGGATIEGINIGVGERRIPRWNGAEGELRFDAARAPAIV